VVKSVEKKKRVADQFAAKYQKDRDRNDFRNSKRKQGSLRDRHQHNRISSDKVAVGKQ